MDSFLQDLRYAARTLVKNPGFAALTILCLSLGIGVNSMMYSVVDSIVRPLPFADPESLVAVHEAHPGSGVDFGDVSYQNLRDFRAEARSFSEIGAYTGRSLTFADGNEPERMTGETVTWNLFPMLGIHPVLGRQFTAEDDKPGAAGTVLLSHGLWQRRYASDRAVIGRVVTLNGAPTTIVGVMPPRFEFPEKVAAWIPMAPIEHASPRGARSLAVIGRLAPGKTIDQARQEMISIARRLEAEHTVESKGWTAALRSIDDALIGSETRLIIFTMMGAVSLVLLIACSNVANLLLARASVRHREMAVRAALGADRGRIVRQLLTESVLIAIVSAPIGIAVSALGLKWLDRAIPPQEAVPYYIDWSLNWRVVVYTVAVALVTGLLFGLAPALHAVRPSLQESLKDRAGGGGSRNRLRGGLVIAEIGLSLVLLVGASLFIRSFLNLQRASAGFETSPLMTLRFYMPGQPYDDGGAMKRRVDDIVRRVEALPGVEAATASNLIPLASGGDGGTATPDGATFAPGDTPRIGFYGVTTHFFRVLGVKMIAGRDFVEADGDGKTHVAIVNQLMARRLWPKTDDVIGQRFRFVNEATDDWMTVVGVVPDVKIDGIRERRPVPRAFASYAYSPTRNTGMTLRVAGGAPAALAQAIRQQIHASDPTVPVFAEQSMDEVRELSFWQYRLFGWMFSIFGGIALALASVGVYGVLSYAVSQRTQEIGVRMALGASRGSVFALFVSQGAKLAGIGILGGVIGAFAVTRVVASILYNVSATDPVSFAATAAFLAAVALLASYVPARRATGVDPMIALRAE